MSHVRQQIRDAVVTALTGLTTTGANVYNSRSYNLPSSKTPCLLVYTNNEDIVYGTKGRGGDIANRHQFRNLELVVQVYAEGVEGTSDPWNTVDDAIVEVEETLAGNLLGGLIRTIELATIAAAQDGQKQEVSSAIMVFNVSYETNSNDVETAI